MSGKIPRLSYTELRKDIADSLAAKYRRLGYLGEFFAATAHQPDALKAFIDFTDAAKGELDQRLVELIALTVATMKDVAYEKHQHERLSVKLGFGREWVRAVEALAPDAQPDFSAAERCVQQFVIAAVRHDGHATEELLDAVVEELDPGRAVAGLNGHGAIHDPRNHGKQFRYQGAGPIDFRGWLRGLSRNMRHANMRADQKCEGMTLW